VEVTVGGSEPEARKRAVKSPGRAEAVMLAFAEMERVLELLEYWRQEAERIKAGNGRQHPNHPERCPECQNPCLSLYGDAGGIRAYTVPPLPVLIYAPAPKSTRPPSAIARLPPEGGAASPPGKP
jgi:hypothetical protein